MAVFRVEKNKGYTVMSNHHLRNRELSLKAKGLLSQMLSLPESWDYTLHGLARINKESIDAIRTAIWELESEEYITRHQGRDSRGSLPLSPIPSMSSHKNQRQTTKVHRCWIIQSRLHRCWKIRQRTIRRRSSR